MPSEYLLAELRDLFITIWSDKGELPTLVDDLGLSRGDLNFDGILRDVWHRIVHLAEQKQKLERLAELAQKRSTFEAPRVQLAWDRYKTRPLGATSLSSGKEGSDWTELSWYLVDRVKQIETFEEQVKLICDRPFVIVWCGDPNARHDMLKRRINDLKPRVGKMTFSPIPKPCRREGDALSNLKRVCMELATGQAEGSDNFECLLVGREFAYQLLTIDVELDWSRETPAQIRAIANWCQQLGPMAQDRRFVVKVAVKTPTPSWSLWSFWKSPEKVFQDYCDALQVALSSQSGVVVLPPLSSIQLVHLQDWRDSMKPRDDDYFGDTKLRQIVPDGEHRPMSHVAEQLEKILKSTIRTFS